jgi:hypothetical protein
MEHKTRSFTYKSTDVDATRNARNYHKCTLLRDLPFSTVKGGGNLHDYQLAKRGMGVELIQETADGHLYGWQGNDIVLDFS